MGNQPGSLHAVLSRLTMLARFCWLNSSRCSLASWMMASTSCTLYTPASQGQASIPTKPTNTCQLGTGQEGWGSSEVHGLLLGGCSLRSTFVWACCRQHGHAWSLGHVQG